MIQRVQSIYLLLAAMANFALFKLPFAEATIPAIESSLFKDGVYIKHGNIIFEDGVYTIQDNTMLVVAYMLAGVLALGAIFLFKNRPLQTKVALCAIVCTAIAAILTIMNYIQDKVLTTGTEIKDGYGLGMPVFAIIFALLAIRYIRKDSALVKSMDRLR
jgi:peptidoglycan/LPS O-acetylase OafA/YrhL